MGYNRKEGFLDLMFPDFTYFGHEYSQIVGEDRLLKMATAANQSTLQSM